MIESDRFIKKERREKKRKGGEGKLTFPVFLPRETFLVSRKHLAAMVL